MRLESLYRLRFTYPEGWEITLTGELGSEEQHLYFAEGHVEGRISGRFRGSNFPRRRTDKTFIPNFHGIIQTDDGATILLEYHGYSRAYPAGRRQWVVAATHLCDDARYSWLNDGISVGTGEVRWQEHADSPELVLDVAELIWEPIAE
jgi:hypothetical protein